MKRRLTLCAIAAIALTLGACVAGSGESQQAASGGWLAQLLLGFWHGVIAPVTLIIEVVNRFAPRLLPWRAHLFERGNTGVIYDVGFYVGLVGGPFFAWSRRR